MSEETANITPYIHLLQGRAAGDVLRQTPAALDALLAQLSPEAIETRPTPEKWSVREQLCHMADCEIAWSWRFRQTYGEDNPTLQSFEQDPWARAYSGVLYTTAQALATWRALRQWNLALLETFSAQDKARPAQHPSAGSLTLWTLVEIAAGHDLHHLASLGKLVAAQPATGPNSPDTTLAGILAFTLECDRLKTVTRKIRVPGTAAQSAEQAGVPPDGIPNRLENSAEHTWQLALFATTLQPFAAQPVHLPRVLEMLLVHDLGEIDTGDTMVFVEGGWDQRKQDELAAVTRIVHLLPPARAAHFLDLWQEFEHGDTPESRFANAVDRAMPPLLNLANNGGSWVEHNISHDRLVTRIRPQIETGCPALWAHIQTQLAAAQTAGWFGTAPHVQTSPSSSELKSSELT